MKKLVLSLTLALGFAGVSCDTMGPNAKTGVVGGAALGGIAGGIIGHNSGGRTLEGAALGAAAGGLLGGVAGSAADDNMGTQPHRYRQY